MYYLLSRYYNPTWGRFLNADTIASTGQGILGNNMFAYCRNNPVRRVDISGSMDQDCNDNDPYSEEDLLKTSEGGGGTAFAKSSGPSGNTFKGGTGTSSARSSPSSKPTNPWGRHGSPAHRSVVDRLRTFFRNLGYNVSTSESRVYCGESGNYRYPDLIVSSDEAVEYYVQVGKQTSKGLPIARELRAINELRSTGIEVWFVPYN